MSDSPLFQDLVAACGQLAHVTALAQSRGRDFISSGTASNLGGQFESAARAVLSEFGQKAASAITEVDAWLALVSAAPKSAWAQVRPVVVSRAEAHLARAQQDAEHAARLHANWHSPANSEATVHPREFEQLGQAIGGLASAYTDLVAVWEAMLEDLRPATSSNVVEIRHSLSAERRDSLRETLNEGKRALTSIE